MNDDLKKILDNSSLEEYSKETVDLLKDVNHFNRMNDPVAYAVIKGPCGDEIEFYLVIKDGLIEDISFYTQGCIATVLFGEMVSCFVLNKSIYDALDVSAKRIMDMLPKLPADHKHCAILAVSTLYRAIAQYLLMD